ncbi:MAG: tyrosine-type recombinase/integrase [Chloracidobacterium sp.]|nr:tyrosine-type recombinase/integrase [Chloracidobacterium sp.]
MKLGKAKSEFISGYFAVNERREKTKSAYVSDLSQFASLIGSEVDVTRLKNWHIERWATDLKAKGYSPASIRRKLVVLKIFFTYWVRKGLLHESPFWRVKIGYGRSIQLPRIITDLELQQILRKGHQLLSHSTGSDSSTGETSRFLKTCDYLLLRNRALLELLFATGLRVGEVSSINVSDYLEQEATIKVTGKAGKERLAFIVDGVAAECLREHLTVRNQIRAKTSALFLNAAGTRLSSQGIANVIHRMRRECGIDRVITPHMFRHTIATLLLRNGVDIRVVQEFLGHSSIATTQRYTHVAKEHMLRELKRRHPSLALSRGIRSTGTNREGPRQ